MAEKLRGLSHKRATEIVAYDPETGIFRWKEKTGRRCIIGSICGCESHLGYRVIGINGTSIYAHRLAWFYMTGEVPSHVDHINMNTRDNSFKNLRAATKALNMMNCGPRSTNNSGYKGVSWDKKRKKWAARIMMDYKGIHLGRYKNKITAAKAYDAAAKKHFGEFARLNFQEKP